MAPWDFSLSGKLIPRTEAAVTASASVRTRGSAQVASLRCLILCASDFQYTGAYAVAWTPARRLAS